MKNKIIGMKKALAKFFIFFFAFPPWMTIALFQIQVIFFFLGCSLQK